MKIAGRQHKTNTGLSAKSKAGSALSYIKFGTSIGKATKQRRKTKGNNAVSFISEQYEQVKTSNGIANQGSPGKNNIELREQRRIFPPHIQIIGSNLQKAAPGIPTLVPGKSPEHLKKFKLQLFPIDEVTREVLEKDKHNPYLELTLGTQKKISSVVKHLNTKWGNSKAASGELMLFPFNARLENLAVHRRWTWKDSDTSAANVYAAVGNPAVFRLRYGWFSNLDPKVCAVPLTPLQSVDNLQDEEIQKMNITGEKKHPFVEASQGHEALSIDSLNQGSGTPIVLDTPVQAANKDTPRKCNDASFSWIDCLSNISFGALLSEASPTPDASRGGHPLPVQNNTSLQQIPNFDSFDAALAAYVAHHQASNTSTQVPHSSIWDAEETCHAFTFQKIISSGKEVPASSNDAPFTSCSQNTSSNFMRLHNTAELGSQVVHMQDQQLPKKGDGCPKPTADSQPDLQYGASEESKAELQRQAEDSHTNDNHFGRMDSYWPGSMDPSEYVAPSSRQIIGSDSIGLSGLIESSLDAFQSFSIF